MLDTVLSCMCVSIRNFMHGVLLLPSLKKQRKLIQGPIMIENELICVIVNTTVKISQRIAVQIHLLHARRDVLSIKIQKCQTRNRRRHVPSSLRPNKVQRDGCDFVEVLRSVGHVPGLSLSLSLFPPRARRAIAGTRGYSTP